MIEKKLKTTQGSLIITIPTHLNEVTLGQMIAMQQKEHLSDMDAISILSGVAIEELQNVRNADDLNVFGDAVLSLSNQIKYLYNSDVIPDKVNFIINEKQVALNVIHNLSVEPAGAFMAARDIIAEEISEHIKLHGEEDWQKRFNPSLKACAQILAQYFYCRATNQPYNEYQVEQFVETVKKLRVTEALPIARHFFMNYPHLSKRRIGCFRRLLLYWKRRQASNRSKNSNISTPSTHFQEATLPNGMLF